MNKSYKASEKKYNKSLKCIISLLKWGCEIGIFITIWLLFKLSSENPFDNHIIGNLSNYFYDVENNSSIINSISFNKNEQKNTTSSGYLLNNTQKIIFSEHFIEKKTNLRKLVAGSFCSEIRGYFDEFKGKKLSNIFDLNYDAIRKLTVAIVVVYCVCDVVTLTALCFDYGYFNDKIYKIPAYVFKSLSISLIIGRFVLLLILFYYFEHSDIESYDNFLDCPRVKVKVFDEFSDVNGLRKSFYAFMILNVINQALDKGNELTEDNNDGENERKK